MKRGARIRCSPLHRSPCPVTLTGRCYGGVTDIALDRFGNGVTACRQIRQRWRRSWSPATGSPPWHGFSKRCVDGLVVNGRLRRAGNRVLVSTCSPTTLEQRMARACAVTGGVVAFPTAGEVWEYRKTPRLPDVHLWIPNNRCVAARDGIRVHRSANLPSADIVRRRDGIVVTSPPRSAFDAAACSRPMISSR